MANKLSQILYWCRLFILLVITCGYTTITAADSLGLPAPNNTSAKINQPLAAPHKKAEIKLPIILPHTKSPKLAQTQQHHIPIALVNASLSNQSNTASALITAAASAPVNTNNSGINNINSINSASTNAATQPPVTTQAASSSINEATAPNHSQPSQTTKKSQTNLNKYLEQNPPAKITLNFTDIKTRELLQVFAQFTDKNFIVSDSVKGSMSIHLKNIPWPQALQVILKSQGLAKTEVSGAVLIAPASEIAAERIRQIQEAQQLSELKTNISIKRLEAKQKIENLQPLYNRVVKLKYAKAEDIVKLLTANGKLLSARGSIGFDTRTNAIWVRDINKQLKTIVRLVKELDFPGKQVEIKARIVSIQRPFERELGIRWGFTSVPNNFSGTLAGANQAITAGTALTSVPIANRLNFNLPANNLVNGTIPPASFGLALAQLGNTRIDLELSALEQEGKIHLVSAPRLVTSNLEPAYIQTGEEIPYQQATSSGATSIEFKDAVLKLEITPFITPDHRVLLNIKVSNNRQGSQVPLQGGGSFVTIATEEEQSRVLVNDGQTVVIGGVYTQDKRKVVTRVPFLGTIPVLGYLFKQTSIRNNRTELLIFLTPRIIKKPSELSKE